MDSHEDRYYSYMLRLWLAYSSEEASWRASLEDPRTGERTGFATMRELFGFLAERTGASNVSMTSSSESADSGPQA